MNRLVDEVLRFVREGALLTASSAAAFPRALVTRARSDAERWMFTEASPGCERPRPGSAPLNWLALRESLVAEINLDAQAMDGYPTRWYEVSGELADEIESAVLEGLPEGFEDFENDIVADLVHCAYARLLDSQGPHREFHELLFRAYQAGLMPCGWEGSYPEGRLAVYVPRDES